MSLEGKLEARQIVHEAGMSGRPEFYSGRGAITDDLNGEKLEQMYGLVKRWHGEDAVQSYVQMVADIPVLSATDFLLSLYRLESNKWKWDEHILGNENGMDVGPDYGDGRREVIAGATIFSVLGGNRNETGAIRNLFLQNHGIDILKTKRVYYDDYCPPARICDC